MNNREIKKLGFGLMRLPVLDRSDPSTVDVEELKRMVDLFMEKGFTYFDTAWMYNGFASEKAAKEALVGRYPRESFTLATKLHSGFIETMDDRDRIFSAQLEKTGAGYFDYYLLHGMSAGSLPKYEGLDCFSWLLGKKREGLVRQAGFLFHDTPELLDKILTEHPEMEFVQLQINYLDWESQWVQSRACYETAVRHGKPVIVMEPVKGGSLANLPAAAADVLNSLGGGTPASYAIRYAAGFEGMIMTLSGMSSIEQLEDNIGFMKDFKPLTEDENAAVKRVVEIMHTKDLIACTACKYCVPGCPMKISIPDLFSCMNAKEITRDWNPGMYYHNVYTKNGGKASSCIKCGRCENVCPQHLPIRDLLIKVAEEFEK